MASPFPPTPLQLFMPSARADNSGAADNLAEMYRGFNTGYIKFETEQQIAGTIGFENFVREAFKLTGV